MSWIRLRPDNEEFKATFTEKRSHFSIHLKDIPQDAIGLVQLEVLDEVSSACSCTAAHHVQDSSLVDPTDEQLPHSRHSLQPLMPDGRTAHSDTPSTLRSGHLVDVCSRVGSPDRRIQETRIGRPNPRASDRYTLLTGYVATA